MKYHDICLLINLMATINCTNKCVIFMIFYGHGESGIYSDLDDSDNDESSEKIKSPNNPINDYVTKHYPDLWKMIKYGDLIEDVAVSGYRSQGRYIVDKNNKKLIIKELYTEIDDYGSILPSMFTITKFPIGYHDDLVTNNHFCPDIKTHRSSWHSETSLQFLDTNHLKLNKLTKDNVYIQSIGKDDQLVYVILTYKKKNYLVGYIIAKNKDTKVITEIQNFIDIFKKQNWFWCDLVDEHVMKIASNEYVDKKNIFLIDYGLV